MQAEFGSGIKTMSDSWIAFQPAIEEPSNICPSVKVSSSMIEMSKVTCCHLPRGSVKRKSAYLTSLSLMSLRTSFALVIDSLPLSWTLADLKRCRPAHFLNRIQPRFPGPDPNRFLDLGDEDLAIADAAGLGRAADGVDRLFDHL